MHPVSTAVWRLILSSGSPRRSRNTISDFRLAHQRSGGVSKPEFPEDTPRATRGSASGTSGLLVGTAPGFDVMGWDIGFIGFQVSCYPVSKKIGGAIRAVYG